MTTTLHAATTDTLDRLSDLDAKVWSRDEIVLNLQDGYDILCTRTGVLFDIAVIENVPISGNWQTDLERYHAQQRPGWGLTDEPFHMTGEHERSLGTGGRVGGTYRGPANITSPTESAVAPSAVVPGGVLPDSTIDVLRVSYNQRGLVGLSSAQMRELDPQYEERVGGDPSYFVMDKDGLNYLRLVPPGQGNAAYDTVSGSWGTLTYTDDTTVTVSTVETEGYDTGGYGILRYRTGTFPSGGPWGTLTRIHPEALNTTVEITRLGRDLGTYHFEIPEAYVKYVIFYAMFRALRRDGPGQDLTLAEHYEQRFEQGVYRLDKRVQNMVPERRGAFGSGEIDDTVRSWRPAATTRIWSATMSIAYYERLTQEDLECGTSLTTKRNPAGGTLTATQVGIHTFAVGQAATSATWDPTSIAAGSYATTTVSVPGAALGDFALASFSIDISALDLSCYVSAADVVTVVLSNHTAAAVDLNSATLRVLVLKSR